MTAPYQLLPPLAPGEMAELRASIEMHGVQVPILVDERGTTIDGHHRRRIADELGIECPTEVREGLSEETKRTLARTLNTARRMLTREQIRAVIAGQLRDTPEQSDNAIAKALHVSDKTVAAERRVQIDVRNIPNVEKRIDSKGRRQPASKPAKKTAPNQINSPIAKNKRAPSKTGPRAEGRRRALAAKLWAHLSAFDDDGLCFENIADLIEAMPESRRADAATLAHKIAQALMYAPVSEGNAIEETSEAV